MTNGVPYVYAVTAVNSDGYESPPSGRVTATPKSKDIYVFMGDINGDANIDIGDPIALLNYLFVSGARPACAKAEDADDDDQLDLGDAMSILNCLFASGPMKAPDGSVVSGGGGSPAACKPYPADGTDGDGKPNFPAAVSELPACENPCQ